MEQGSYVSNGAGLVTYFRIAKGIYFNILMVLSQGGRYVDLNDFYSIDTIKSVTLSPPKLYMTIIYDLCMIVI